MGDLFGSFAESTCAALVLVASSHALENSWKALMYPVLISSLGIAVGVLSLILRTVIYRVHDEYGAVEKALKGILTISTVLMSPVVVVLSWMCLPDQFDMSEKVTGVRWWYCALAILLGLWSGLLIGFVTEYYTSSSYIPVREIAETEKQSAATGIIYGLALGYLSTIIPVVSLGITILVAHSLCGMFGVALGALGMLGTLTMGLTIDAFGPISDNAGGIAEMSQLDEWVRERTDVLDAAGNTTAAIGKGFAIGSAALVSLALFGAFCVRANITGVDILHPWVFTGLLFGAMMPYAFAALTMKSVGKAANEMVKECMLQFPKIIDGSAEPDYEKCILISTKASLNEMLAPGALVILPPDCRIFVWKVDLCGFVVRRSSVERPTCHLHEQHWWRVGQCEEIHFGRRTWTRPRQGFRHSQEFGHRRHRWRSLEGHFRSSFEHCHEADRDPQPRVWVSHR